MYTCKFSFLSFFNPQIPCSPPILIFFSFFRLAGEGIVARSSWWKVDCSHPTPCHYHVGQTSPIFFFTSTSISTFTFHTHFHFPYSLSLSTSTLTFHIHFYFPFPLSLSTPTFHIHFHFSYPLSLSNSLFTIYFYALWKEKSLYRTSSHYHVGQTSLPTKSMANHPQIFV